MEGEVKHECRICKKVFTLKKNLVRHQKTVHEKCKKHECGICQKKFSRKSHKDMHLRICSRNVACGKTFTAEETTETAGGSVPLPAEKVKEPTVLGMTRDVWEKKENVEKRVPNLRFTPVLLQSAFGGCFADWTIRFPVDYDRIDLRILLSESTLAMRDTILDTLWAHTKVLKFTMAVHVVYMQGTDPDVKTDPPVVLHTGSSDMIVVATDMYECLNGMAQQLYEMIETYEGNGSGWVFDRLVRLDTNIASCAPL